MEAKGESVESSVCESVLQGIRVSGEKRCVDSNRIPGTSVQTLCPLTSSLSIARDRLDGNPMPLVYTRRWHQTPSDQERELVGMKMGGRLSH